MEKIWRPARTEYFLVGVDERGGRIEYYNGQVYRSRKTAEADAKRMRSRRRIEVGSVKRPGDYVYRMSINL